MCPEKHSRNWMTTPEALMAIRMKLGENAHDSDMELALTVLTLTIPRSCDVTTMSDAELRAALAEHLWRSMNLSGGNAARTQELGCRMDIGGQPVDIVITARPLEGQVHPPA